MLKNFSVAASLLLASSIASASPTITLLNNHYGLSQAPIDSITRIVKQTLNAANQSNYASAKVQPIYNSEGSMDHLLVYLPSKTNYSMSVMRINLKQSDTQYTASKVINNYTLSSSDWQQQPGVQNAKCPNPKVEFVAATSVPDYPTAKQYVDEVYQSAKKHGYNTVELLGDEASTTNYENYLSCPKLKGFYNIGHGSPDGILLSDGMLGTEQFSQMHKELNERAVVVLNSCNVFMDPLKSAVIDGSDPQKYSGGISTLLIGTSEPASACFWEHAFDGKPMTQWLNSCATKIDPNDTWGIGGNGSDTLNQPA